MFSLRQFAKPLLPPIVADLARAILRATGARDVPEFEYVKDGWTDTVNGRPVRGWNVEAVAAALRASLERTGTACDEPKPFDRSNEAFGEGRPDVGFHNNVMSFAYVLACASQGKNRISILDWGGGSGAYYLMARSLYPSLQVSYTCKELPAICRHCSTANPEVVFVSDESSALNGRYDLVLASGSLNYSRNWCEVLTGILSCSLAHTYITRFPLVESCPSYVMIQRAYSYGYNTEYLGWCINRDEVLGVARKCGVKLKREFLCGDADRILVAGAPEQACYRGFLFEKVSSPSGDA